MNSENKLLLVLRLLVAPVLCLFALPLLAQNCNCKSDFEWLKKTFVENDAGYSYVLERKGQAALDYHTKAIQPKIDSAASKEVCATIMLEWLRFFRRGHLYVQLIDKESGNNPHYRKLDSTAIIKLHKDWPRIELDTLRFTRYLNAKKTQDFEGIWDAAHFTIAIKKTDSGYIGVLVKDVLPYWKAGQIKLRIIKDGDQFKGIYYLLDHSVAPQSFVRNWGINNLVVANQALKRVVPKFETEKPVVEYFESLKTRTPYMKPLNSTTLYFRIPSFDSKNKRLIDSILKSNELLISKTPYWIIDLRGNGGGSDISYSGIIPFLYTNPIRKIGVQFWSSELNNQRMKNYLNNPDYKLTETDKKWVNDSYTKLENHLGEFVNLNAWSVGTNSQDSIKEYPKNVGILIDGVIGSTTEQFLLEAKQSKKVKLFGTTTFGSLDMSNMYQTKCPCGDFELGYALSRSYRLPEFSIDGIGLQPDYFLDGSIKNSEWIDFVNQILDSK